MRPSMALPVVLIAIIAFLLLRGKSYGRSPGSDYSPEDLRRTDLAALARKLQLQFSPRYDFDAPKRLSFLSWINRGIAPSTYNTFHGYYQGYPVTFFDYTFSDGKNNYYWSTYLLEMSTSFPDVLVSHETMESRIAEGLGESHITFESAEFSRAFRVRSPDKKFAYEICDAKMMEYLLANQDLTIEIKGRTIAVMFEDWLRPDKVEHNLSRLIEIRKFLPNYLFEKGRR
jgi:hypothetical protein